MEGGVSLEGKQGEVGALGLHHVTLGKWREWGSPDGRQAEDGLDALSGRVGAGCPVNAGVRLKGAVDVTSLGWSSAELWALLGLLG